MEYAAGVLWFDNRVDSETERRVEDFPVAFIAGAAAPQGSPLLNNIPKEVVDSLGVPTR